MLRIIIFIIFFVIGAQMYWEGGVTQDECTEKNIARANITPDCARELWGENYFYVSKKIYKDEVRPYEINAEKFAPGHYTLTTSNNENIVFEVTYRKPFYCGKAKRVLHNRVKRKKAIRILDG